ncbi:chitinase protein PB1E7.04c [Biomphalaria glabrata]|nr:chitinase protein PB1E7.04c [Biomphalaria glabrata]
MTNILKSPLTSSESETCISQSLNDIVLPDATESTSLIQELASTNTGMLTPDLTTAAAAYTTQITSPFLNAMTNVSSHSETTALANITNIAKSRKNVCSSNTRVSHNKSYRTFVTYRPHDK